MNKSIFLLLEFLSPFQVSRFLGFLEVINGYGHPLPKNLINGGIVTETDVVPTSVNKKRQPPKMNYVVLYVVCWLRSCHHSCNTSAHSSNINWCMQDYRITRLQAPSLQQWLTRLQDYLLAAIFLTSSSAALVSVFQKCWQGGAYGDFVNLVIYRLSLNLLEVQIGRCLWWLCQSRDLLAQSQSFRGFDREIPIVSLYISRSTSSALVFQMWS